jgi:hypothetical protein
MRFTNAEQNQQVKRRPYIGRKACRSSFHAYDLKV